MWGIWFFSSLQCDSYEIRPGKHLGVCISVANNRLFVGSIPKNKTKENILEEFSKVTGKTKMYLEVSFGKSVVIYKCKKKKVSINLKNSNVYSMSKSLYSALD